VKIDLHVHYKRHAKDAEGYEEAMAQAALAAGLNGIAFTEHGQQLPEARLDELRAKFSPLAIWSGAEVGCAGHDFLVYGIADLTNLVGCLHPANLAGRVHEAEGAIILAHPFRKNRLTDDCRASLRWLHGIEIVSRNTPPWAAPFIAMLAAQNGMPVYVNSDAHKPRNIGGHFNMVSELPTNLASWLRSNAPCAS